MKHHTKHTKSKKTKVSKTFKKKVEKVLDTDLKREQKKWTFDASTNNSLSTVTMSGGKDGGGAPNNTPTGLNIQGYDLLGAMVPMNLPSSNSSNDSAYINPSSNEIIVDEIHVKGMFKFASEYSGNPTNGFVRIMAIVDHGAGGMGAASNVFDNATQTYTGGRPATAPLYLFNSNDTILTSTNIFQFASPASLFREQAVSKGNKRFTVLIDKVIKVNNLLNSCRPFEIKKKVNVRVGWNIYDQSDGNKVFAYTKNQILFYAIADTENAEHTGTNVIQAGYQVYTKYHEVGSYGGPSH